MVLLASASADSDAPLPAKPPVPVPKPRLGVLSAARTGALSSARIVAQYTAAVAPYVVDPNKLFQLSVRASCTRQHTH